MAHRAPVKDTLSLAEARRIALAAQGFDRPRPSRRIQYADIRRVIHRLSLVQLDYVNILIPAHYTVLFSRLGPYDRNLLDELIYRRREFLEHWAHEASIVPVSSWPLLEHRRKSHRVRPWGFEKFLAANPAYVEWVLQQVHERGPLTPGQLDTPEGMERRLPESWFGTVPRAILEAFFGTGEIAIANRLENFARVYDLAHRVVAAVHYQATASSDEAQRELLRFAARGHGIATAADLADYYRMPVREARPRIAELVADGDLREVRVECWREPAFLHRDARLPRSISAQTLLAPFDPLIWFRPRTKRLFEFDYRFEIFVPPGKVKWGRYVMPLLLGDRLVARVDVKAGRENSRLMALAVFLEDDCDTDQTFEAMAKELRTLAGWLGLESVAFPPRGGKTRDAIKQLGRFL
jgi:uncharacterized protein YcaQ